MNIAGSQLKKSDAVTSSAAGEKSVENSTDKPEASDKSATAEEPKSGAESGAELDVESMMKDFSDKLQENLLPDPWD